MTQSQHCLSFDDLRVFLEGRATQVEDAAIVAHLDYCAACRDALEENAGGAKWLGQIHELLSHSACEPATEDRDEGSPTTIDSFLIANRLTFLTPSDDPRMIGRMGVYEVLGVIGSGGMGVILKALEPALNRYVALKVLWPHLAVHGAARQRFAREARAAAAVVHEHVVPIYAVDECQGLPYIVMQYIPGRSLQERISRDGALAIEQVLRIGRQIASALDAAHAQGLVHRDVKPGNILLENGIERVLVTDFGLARAADDASLTHSGMIAGTPQFMSPEQARGEPMDQRSDLFSLGTVLYTMCSGHPPFRAETMMGSLTRICNDAPRPLREVNANVPQWLDAFIARLMAKDPSRRFQSAADVTRILEKELAHLQNPLNVLRPNRNWKSRNWIASDWPFAAASAIALVCLLLMLVYRPWNLPEMFPGNHGSEINGFAHSEGNEKAAAASAKHLEPMPLPKTVSEVVSETAGTVLSKDPLALVIAQLKTDVEKFERRLVAPQPVDLSEIENPWTRARRAAEELEQQLAPNRSGF